MRSYEIMEEFGELRGKWLRKWLELPVGLKVVFSAALAVVGVSPGIRMREA